MLKNARLWVDVGVLLFAVHGVSGAFLFVYQDPENYRETKICFDGPHVTIHNLYAVTITEEGDYGDTIRYFPKCQQNGERANLICQDKYQRIVIKNISSPEIEVTWHYRTCSHCTCNPTNKNPHWSVKTFAAQKN